jgi:hypothetical protein
VGQDREIGKGLRVTPSPTPPREPWDHERELARDRRVERTLLWKEVAVVSLLAALVVLRIVFAA